LPAGVTSVTGGFDEGDVVEVRDSANAIIARGMVLSDAPTLRQIIGRRTTELPSDVAHEVIHRDDLVLLIE
ncbi:MAG: PUA domain-containing protein, partial [Ilumatobacteraceae bacterium]